MNPSATGWIDKFGYLVKDEASGYRDFDHLYDALKEVGFVYGMNIRIPSFITPEIKLSEDEKAKINLLAALYFTYRFEEDHPDFDAFLARVFHFYQDLGLHQISFLSKIFSGKQDIPPARKAHGIPDIY